MELREPSLADRIAFGAVMVAASARALVAFAPLPVFDIDPALDSAPFVGATPAESVLFDALALAGSAWLLSQWRVPRSGLVPWLALGVLAAAIVLGVHAANDAEQLWRGSTWFASAIGACAVAAAISRDSSRTLAVAGTAGVVGVGALMAVRGLAQMASEHPSMVAYYEATREVFLRAQGWLVDSPQALAYERRLRQNEPTAWFGLSNVFATAAGSVAVLVGSLAITRRDSASSRNDAVRWVLALAAALCGGLVVASGSKGGVAALALGIAIVALARRRAQWMPWVLCGLPFVVLIAITLRGVIGTNSSEQSLLFRSYYLAGAWRTVLAHPWWGVGPAGFQRAFLETRPMECVEEVQSAHAAIPDFLVALGIAGVGLIALQLALAWRAGRGVLAAQPLASAPERTAREVALATVAIAGVLSITFEAAALDGVAALGWRLAGLACGLLVAFAVVRSLAKSGGAAAAAGLAALAAVVVTHGEVDMAFWLPGSSMWVWITLSVAGGCCAAQLAREEVVERRGSFVSVALALVLLSVSGWLGFLAAPALRAQDTLAIDAASEVHARTQKGSARDLAEARAEAAEALSVAAVMWPPRGAYAVRAAEQWHAAASLDGANPSAAEWLAKATLSAAFAAQTNPSRFGGALTGSLIAIARAQRGEVSWTEAAHALEAVLRVDGRHTESWIRLADALDRAGDASGARVAAAMALACDESFAADQLRQLSLTRRRALIERAGRESQ